MNPKNISPRSNYLLPLFTCLTVMGLSAIAPVRADIIPDRTLPNPSRTNTREDRIEITGGTQTGSNLFHSFREFSVSNGQEASFREIDPGVENIFTRVTGSSPSQILGTIEALNTLNQVSSANFFLINPNGIFFGENAALNIGGSFLATTAERINFADDSWFSATQPRSSLLSISVPTGLQFGRNPAPIENRSITEPPPGSENPDDPIGLAVAADQTLALAGGEITFSGGEITAGRIEIGSVASSGQVALVSLPQGWRLNYGDIQQFGDIQLTDVADLDASGNAGGSIRLRGDRIEISGDSLVRADTLGERNGSGINIRANQVEIEGGVQIKPTDPSQIRALVYGSGNGGNISISTNSLRLTSGGQITTDVVRDATGNAGNIRVNARDIELVGVVLNDRGEPLLSKQVTFPSTISAFTRSAGNAGNIFITTDRLSLRDGATIQSSTQGSGNAGRIEIQATERIELSGTALGLSIPTGLLTFSGGIPQTEAFAINPNATGSAGILDITTDELIVQDRAILATGSVNPNLNETAVAGQLNINANQVRVANQALISTGTNAGGGGNMNLQINDLLVLQQGGTLSTTAGEAQRGGNGGNIQLNTDFIISSLSSNSDITANAFTGNGGNVNIDAAFVLGIRPQAQLTPQSDITASSERGVDGEIRIKTYLLCRLNRKPPMLTEAVPEILALAIAPTPLSGLGAVDFPPLPTTH
jgi:filamentous hemagglutinin family protein